MVNPTSAQPPPPSTVAGAQTRRLACDRCRGHKLRCERASMTSDCQRCSRARAECITSPVHRIGRPSISKRFPEPSSAEPESGSALAPSSDTVAGDLALFHRGREAESSSIDQSLISSNAETTDSPRFLAPTPTDEINGDYPANDLLADSQNPFEAPDWSSDFGNQFNAFDVVNANTSPLGSATNRSRDENPLSDMDFSFDMLAAFSSSVKTHASREMENEMPELSPIAIRETQLQKLSALNASLSAQLNRVSDGQLGNILAFSPCKPDLYGQSPSHPIGSLLDSSEKFVELLGYFLNVSSGVMPSDTLQSGNGEGSDSGTHRDAIMGARNVSPILSQPETRPSSFGQFTSSTSVPSQQGQISAKTNGSDYWQPDLSTFLAMLACYVSLVRISKFVFAHVHIALLSCPSPRGKALTTLPSLQFPGFKISGDRHLQVKLVMQAIKHSFDKIEKALAEIDTRCNGANDGERGILETVIKKEAMEGRDSHIGRVPPLSETMKNIDYFMAKSAAW